MSRRSRTLLAIVTAVAINGTVMRSEAGPSGSSPNLSQLLAALHLTDGGVLVWRDRLMRAPQAGPASQGRERMIAVTADGHVITENEGLGSHVAVSAALDARCLQPGAGIILVHNHPNSTGLSVDDLGQLAKPGVLAVVAVGHDGSVYAAAAGPQFPRDRFGDHLYAPALAEAGRELRRVEAAGHTTDLDVFLAHVMSVALADARVIRYEAILGPDRQVAYDRDRQSLGRITAMAKHVIGGALAQLR